MWKDLGGMDMVRKRKVVMCKPIKHKLFCLHRNKELTDSYTKFGNLSKTVAVDVGEYYCPRCGKKWEEQWYERIDK